MKSAIQKNLGGPLSEVFFSSLTPLQQDHVGYTPKLQGPGRELWVSPSDNLIGKVILKPPYTRNTLKSLTHKGIMEMGAEIEEKMIRAHEIKMQAAIKKKEEEMVKLCEQLIRNAVAADRLIQEKATNQLMEAFQKNLSSTYQIILKSTVDELMESAVQQMEDAVKHTQRKLERELCRAVESHRQYLGKQYELQVSWIKNQLEEKYENILKKKGQHCTEEMERITNECISRIKRSLVHIQAEHITDLVVQACEKSLVHHNEKKHLESNFGAWFVTNFNNEILNRDFTILELEDVIRKLEGQSKRREEQLRDIFKHFQKFINFSLQEKPGQAEFLLSLEKELKTIQSQVKTEGEVEFIAKMIIDFILRNISEKTADDTSLKKYKEEGEMNMDNFRDKISEERGNNRILTLLGEEKSNCKPEKHVQIPGKEVFKESRINSLVSMFKRNPSLVHMITSLHTLPLSDIIEKDSA